MAWQLFWLPGLGWCFYPAARSCQQPVARLSTWQPSWITMRILILWQRHMSMMGTRSCWMRASVMAVAPGIWRISPTPILFWPASRRSLKNRILCSMSALSFNVISNLLRAGCRALLISSPGDLLHLSISSSSGSLFRTILEFASARPSGHGGRDRRFQLTCINERCIKHEPDGWSVSPMRWKAVTDIKSVNVYCMWASNGGRARESHFGD